MILINYSLRFVDRFIKQLCNYLLAFRRNIEAIILEFRLPLATSLSILFLKSQ
jgi:hypothetical protein